MGFVRLSFPVNPLRLRDWGSGCAWGRGWGPRGQPALLCQGKLRHTPSGQQRIRKDIGNTVCCGQGAEYRQVPGCERGLGCGQGSGLCACSRLPPSARLQRRRLGASPELPGRSRTGGTDVSVPAPPLPARAPESSAGRQSCSWGPADAGVLVWWAAARSRSALSAAASVVVLCSWRGIGWARAAASPPPERN